MLEEFEKTNKVVGIKQSTRAIEKGEAKTAYVAKDADELIIADFKKLCIEHGVEIVIVDTMKQLGKMCNIEVGAATAVVLK